MPQYRMTKNVPAARSEEYIKAGWIVFDSAFPTPKPDFVAIRKSVKTNAPHDDHDVLRFRQPHLIQRGSINRLSKRSRLTEAVALDYMGAAEFEFGALPKSLRCIESQFHLYQTHTFADIWVYHEEHMTPLQVFANFDTDEDRTQYLDWLNKIINNESHPKEWTRLEIGNRLSFDARAALRQEGKSEDAHTEPDKTNFWWDVDNHVMFSFNNKFMKRLPEFLANSFEYMAIK
jgi:hypothetical protein